MCTTILLSTFIWIWFPAPLLLVKCLPACKLIFQKSKHLMNKQGVKVQFHGVPKYQDQLLVLTVYSCKHAQHKINITLIYINLLESLIKVEASTTHQGYKKTTTGSDPWKISPSVEQCLQLWSIYQQQEHINMLDVLNNIHANLKNS